MNKSPEIWFERTAVRDAILTNMKNLLRRARETYEYFNSDDHYWLEKNTKIPVTMAGIPFITIRMVIAPKPPFGFGATVWNPQSVDLFIILPLKS